MAYNVGYNDDKGNFVPYCAVPSDPSELTPEMFVRFTALAEQTDRGDITLQSAAVTLAMELLGPTPDVFNKTMEENVAFVASLAEPLFRLPLEVNVNPVRSIAIPGRRPVPALGFGFYDASVREYLDFITRMDRFTAAAKDAAENPAAVAVRDAALDSLICSLYPVREERFALAVAAAVKGFSPCLKLHLLRHLRASHECLSQGSFDYYSSGISFRDIFCPDGTKSAEKNDSCFADAVVSVAEAGPFGHYEKTLDTSLFMVLRYMQTRYRESKKIKDNVKRKGTRRTS